MAWIERVTIDLSINELHFSEDETMELIDFSKLRVILFDNKSAYDLGALCFRERRRKQSHPSQKGYTIWQVDPKTFCSERKIVIQQFARYIYSLHRFGKRPTTMLDIIKAFTRFIEWCDQHYSTVFLTPTDSRNAYGLYSQMLLEKIRQNALRINSAAITQHQVATILNAIFEDNQGTLTAGIKKIRTNTFATIPTAPPSEEIAQQAIALYTHLFTGISNFLLSFEHYPFQMKLPKESVWVFPVNTPFATQSMLTNRNKWGHPCWAWDYVKGRIAIYETIRFHYPRPKFAKYAINDAEQFLERANRDYRHRARLALASLAIQCFTMLFIANTAMNITPLSQLSWNTGSDFECIKSRSQGFRTIKYRAGGAYVEFQITNIFLFYFRKYLKLREWVLQGVKAPLFFILDKQWHPKEIDKTLTKKLRMKLKKFNLNLPSARQWRAYKADWLIRTTDLETTALLLQNSKETVLKNYIAGSKVRADEEMGDFFKKLHLKVVKPSTNATAEISVGQCREYQAPKSENTQNAIQPNCSQPEGCLFCVNYQVHADEQDIRKLYSCRYVITETRTLAASASHFENFFGSTLKRIDALLKCIASKSQVLERTVRRVQHEVIEEGKLTAYWASKLRTLIELELM